MRSCATQKNCCMTFWGGWKNSLVFLNNLSVDHKYDAQGFFVAIGRYMHYRQADSGKNSFITSTWKWIECNQIILLCLEALCYLKEYLVMEEEKSCLDTWVFLPFHQERCSKSTIVFPQQTSWPLRILNVYSVNLKIVYIFIYECKCASSISFLTWTLFHRYYKEEKPLQDDWPQCGLW